MNIRVKNIVAALLVLFGVLIYWGFSHKNRKQNEIINGRMPHFIARNSTGTEIDSKKLLGKFVYLQFVDIQRQEDMNLFETMYQNWKNEDLVILVVGDNLQPNIKINGNFLADITILTDLRKTFSQIFDISSTANKYFLFDKLGKLICSGENSIGYERVLKIQLLKHIKKCLLSPLELAGLKEDINRVTASKANREINVDENREYCIVSLFNLFCNSCSSGPIIDLLKRISKERENVQVIGVLSATYYGHGDLQTIISQSQVEFPVIIADNELDKKWSLLIKKYNNYELNGVLFLINKDGEILKMAYPGCNCYGEFIKHVNDL
jgi:hypothetical protein